MRKTGTFYRHTTSGEVFILSLVADHRVSLICLNDGNRWADGSPVENPDKITPREWATIIGDYDANFIRIKPLV